MGKAKTASRRWSSGVRFESDEATSGWIAHCTKRAEAPQSVVSIELLVTASETLVRLKPAPVGCRAASRATLCVGMGKWRRLSLYDGRNNLSVIVSAEPAAEFGGALKQKAVSHTFDGSVCDSLDER